MKKIWITPPFDAIIDNIFQSFLTFSLTLIFLLTFICIATTYLYGVWVIIFLLYEGAHLCFSYIKSESCLLISSISTFTFLFIFVQCRQNALKCPPSCSPTLTKGGDWLVWNYWLIFLTGELIQKERSEMCSQASWGCWGDKSVTYLMCERMRVAMLAGELA